MPGNTASKRWSLWLVRIDFNQKVDGTMFQILEAILWELQEIPGLGFLRSLREQITLKRGQYEKKIHVLNNRRKDLMNSGNRIRNARKGLKQRDE